MATHSSILAWEIPWTKKPGGLHSPWDHKGAGLNWARRHVSICSVCICHLSFHLTISSISFCSLSPEYRACPVEGSVVLFSQPAQPKLEAVDSEWSPSKCSVKYSLENLPGPSSSHSDEPLCDPKLLSACTYWMLEIFLVAQTVKNLPAVWETQVGSLGQEDPLEKEMATHSSILAWKIPWTEEPSKLQSMGSQRVGHDWATSLHWMLSCSWWFTCLSPPPHYTLWGTNFICVTDEHQGRKVHW